LEVPESSVPDFPGGDDYIESIDAFLKPFGVHYVQRPITSAPPKNWHLIEGVSPRSGMHAVVGFNGRFKFDPHPQDGTGRGLVKKKTWGVLMPIDQEVKPVGVAYGTKNPEAKNVYISAPDGAPGGHVMNGRPTKIRQAKDIERGPGPFTVQLTEKDGREHIEPVSALRTYDSAVPLPKSDADRATYKAALERRIPELKSGNVRGQQSHDLEQAKAQLRRLGKTTDSVSIETLQKKLESAEKRLQNVRDAISIATAKRKNRRQRLQSSAEMTARGKFNDAYSAVREARAALEAAGGKAKDGALSTAGLLLAALWAWYRSRMDEPAQQLRNWDLNTYTPRQRMLDSKSGASANAMKMARAAYKKAKADGKSNAEAEVIFKDTFVKSTLSRHPEYYK
jgi:hypothetical protein